MDSVSAKWKSGLLRHTARPVKSDDVTGRVRTYEAIVKGQNVPNPGVPEAFKVLVKELQSLCLDVRVRNSKGAQA